MRIEHLVCDARKCGAMTTNPVGEKWTTVYVGKDFQGDFCPDHSVELSTVDHRDHRERWKEIDVKVKS